MISFDLAQLENKMVVDMNCKNDAVKELASKIYGKPYEEVTTKERQSVKNHPSFWLAMYGS